MAKLIEKAEYELYTSEKYDFSVRKYCNDNHYSHPIICSKCGHDFRTGKMDYDKYKRVIQYKSCPYCKEKFTEFIDCDGKVITNEQEEFDNYREFIIVSNSTFEEQKGLIEHLDDNKKDWIMTGSREEIQEYLDKIGVETHDYDIVEEYTVEVVDELFDFVGFEDTENMSIW